MTKYYVTDGRIKIRHVGILELGIFYTWLQRWFAFEFSWKDTNEKYYREVILPDGAKNIEMSWEVRKSISSYFDYVSEVDFLLVAISDSEIQTEGKRRKVQKGDFEIGIVAYVETNPKKVGKRGSAFSKVLEGLLLRKRIDQHKILLFEKVTKLSDEVKEIFKQYEIE